MELETALTVDADITAFEPQLAGSPSLFGRISTLHEAASDEVVRDLRTRWWPSQVCKLRDLYPDLDFITNDTPAQMDASKLDRDQLHRAAIFRLLGWHVWPRLDTHNGTDTMMSKKAAHWKSRYMEEMDALLAVGIIYDWGSLAAPSSAQTTRRAPRIVRS